MTRTAPRPLAPLAALAAVARSQPCTGGPPSWAVGGRARQLTRRARTRTRTSTSTNTTAALKLCARDDTQHTQHRQSLVSRRRPRHHYPSASASAFSAAKRPTTDNHTMRATAQ
ncbi:hypothetical protein B5807_02871 [Epicoccum nigrum]|uniref:Uncharacterized protein n=1 Tax=Epicoccum nigrum TaxID=105696 RepID=A0A1Y2M9J3_EPING|nr:hypothetical protein B5807_02871 [Epicoccum nigrum]